MSIIRPNYFRCQHKKLTKKKYSNTLYSCNECNKEFNLLPVKHDPILLPDIDSPFSQSPEYGFHQKLKKYNKKEDSKYV